MGEGGDFGYVEAAEPTPEPPMDVHIDRSQIADIAREIQQQSIDAALQKFITSPMFL